MKRFLLSVIVLLTAFAGVNGQEWSTTLRTSDGLPGIEMDYYGTSYYQYTSPLLTPGVSTNKVRVTVTSTETDEAPNGNNIVFALAEMKVYDEDGNSVSYEASSNADHNSLAYYADGDGLPALNDDDYKSYFHSMWRGENPVSDYHYVELTLERSVDAFSIEWITRLGQSKNSPTEVGITLGTDYVKEEVGKDFTLGAAVSSLQELKAEGGMFVLKSNAVESFTASNGITYGGSGPIYMRCAEEGDKEASAANVMQLLPYDDEHYVVYWPMSGLYLANSSGDFNGLNGWQYSINNLSGAAHVKITMREDGKFEMQYDGANSSEMLTLYIGAEMRDYSIYSKMKTFDLEHKLALENGDYTHGYSLPIAFDWDIYKALTEDAVLKSMMLSLTKIAENALLQDVNEANAYMAEYGDFNGDCTNGEDDALRLAITDAEYKITTIKNISEVEAVKSSLSIALSRYMAAGIKEYERRVAEIKSAATFSSYPYVEGTYPESSRSILDGIVSTIETAKEAAGIYTAAQYEAIYSQLESDIAMFESTKIQGSGGEDGDDDDVITEEGEIVYVYLTNGNIDAYSLNSIDGGYYIENDKLYFPIKDGDVIYYTKEEYDSCSTVAPQLPTMTSFKFNNKYNPNLNVDAVAENVTENMYFSLNAIGKWLTASFQLSDEKAVAYVDTTMQVSKVTRQSFANRVTYIVTYPGYNIIERVKVQDEVWTTPSVAGETTEIPLTAEMLSTNKPSQNYSEGLENLLDGDPYSIFHSTWGSANNATANVNTYIDIELPEEQENIKIYYKCRPTSTGYNPKVWEIYASNDGYTWTLVRTLDYAEDNMPLGGYGQEYTSPTIALGDKYSYIRILQTSGEYSKNHLVLSELRLYKVTPETTEEPVKIQDAIYENRFRPFGTKYNVNVEWLTDNATSIPRIDIDIEGGKTVTSKDYYLNARIRITGYGVYENFDDSVQIKGRGNSSWGQSKKPYRLKFAEKKKPFGLTKGKSWVLLANAQRGSLMANAISMKIGQMAGTEYVNHIIPVDLYMNGTYLGNYMFTEKVGMANNSVDIDEELGYLLELDTYGSSDEPIYRTGLHNLPVKIADPDLSDYSTEVATARRQAIINDMKEMSSVVYNGGDLETVLNVDALSRFYLANDLSLNQEINHPKSTFLYKNEGDPDGKLSFGPIWDFDWGYGYEKNSSYCYYGATSSVISSSMAAYNFWEDITENEIFQRYYYKAWKIFNESNCIEELKDYIDSYYNFAKNSFQSNANIWGTGFGESDRDRAKEWLEQRANYISSNLNEYNIDDLLHMLTGDVNCNDVLTVHDVALIAAYLDGETHEKLNMRKADVDKNGNIEIADAATTAELVLDSDAPSSMYWHSTPVGEGYFAENNHELEVGADCEIPLVLTCSDNETYSALQFDINVPDGMDIYDIVLNDNFVDCELIYSQKDMNNFRVVAYFKNYAEFGTGDVEIAKLTACASSIIEEDARKLLISNIYAVEDYENNEVRLDNSSIGFTQTTSIDGTYATYSVKGGKCITVTVLKAQEIDIYSVDGRLVRKLNAKEGTTKVTVPQGVYLVNGEKVFVY